MNERRDAVSNVSLVFAFCAECLFLLIYVSFIGCLDELYSGPDHMTALALSPCVHHEIGRHVLLLHMAVPLMKQHLKQEECH